MNNRILLLCSVSEKSYLKFVASNKNQYVRKSSCFTFENYTYSVWLHLKRFYLNANRVAKLKKSSKDVNKVYDIIADFQGFFISYLTVFTLKSAKD